VPGVAARLLALALAVFLAGFAAIELHDSAQCRTYSDAFVKLSLGIPVKTSDSFIDGFMDECRGSHLLAIAAKVLGDHRHVGQAIRVSDEAIRREPDNYEGWFALSEALRHRNLDAAAERALRRALALNPRFERHPG
jgi:tetratricopeptide (TPR) repeat protein